MPRRFVISPELLTDAELEELLLTGPQTVWKEGEHWRLCQYVSGYDAALLLQQGWEFFDDGEDET